MSRSILLRAVTRLLPLLRNPRLNENVAGPQNNAHTTRRRRRIMRNVTQSKRYWAYKQQRRGRWRRRDTGTIRGGEEDWGFLTEMISLSQDWGIITNTGEPQIDRGTLAA